MYTYYVDLTATSEHMNREFKFLSIRNYLPSSEGSEGVHLIEDPYQCRKPYMFDENINTETFQSSTSVGQGGNESPGLNLFFLDSMM